MASNIPVISDFQLMRCSLKILEVLTMKPLSSATQHSTVHQGATRKRHRSRKASTLIASPTAPRNDEECPTSTTTTKDSKQVLPEARGSGDGSLLDKELKERVEEGADEEKGMEEMLREVVRNLLGLIISALAQVRCSCAWLCVFL